MALKIFSSLVLVLFGIVTFSNQAHQSAIPRLLILGPTGTEKMKIANILLGSPLSSDNRLTKTETCAQSDFCGFEATGKWMGRGDKFTTIVAPDFENSKGQESEQIHLMIDYLKYDVGSANGILLLFDAQKSKFDTIFYRMLRSLQLMFGDEIWSYVVLGLTNWGYDHESVSQRMKSKITEESKMEEINDILNDNLYISQNIPGVFLNPNALQSGEEEEHDIFTREIAKLWNLISNEKIFEFKLMEDILDHLCTCQSKSISESILPEVLELKERTKQLIELMHDEKAKIDAKVNSLESKIDNERKSVEQKIDSLHQAPIGTILAWVPKPNKNSTTMENIPNCWIECDGRLIFNGVWKGQTTPDLNNEQRFLRGGVQSEALETQQDALQKHEHNLHDPGHDHSYIDGHVNIGKDEVKRNGNRGPKYHDLLSDEWNKLTTRYTKSSTSKIRVQEVRAAQTADETRPKNMKVTFIMKVC